MFKLKRKFNFTVKQNLIEFHCKNGFSISHKMLNILYLSILHSCAVTTYLS